MKNFDIYLVGVGGQGTLTVGEILAKAAFAKNIPVSYFPSKGMAQRGGFVKAQLRMGRDAAGPNIPLRSADLVVSMELSESLRAVGMVKPGGEFVLFAERWEPTAVMLKKAAYPDLQSVQAEILKEGAKLVLFDPEQIPVVQGERVSENMFILGALLEHTQLGKIILPKDVLEAVESRWPRSAELNRTAFQAGIESKPKALETLKEGD